MRKDISEERALFSQALREGLAGKFEAELAQCPGPIQCSEEHLRKMNEIIEDHARAARIARLKRRIAAAMVAVALLMLTACAAYVYRREIKKLFVKVYETSIELFYDDEAMPNKMISEYYTLSYVPEGYELTEKVRLSSAGSETWKTADGEYIVLEQFVWDGANYWIDAEMGETTVTTFESIEVYYRATQLHTYVWNDGTYSFILSSSSFLTNEEIGLIIDGLTIEQ